MKFSENWLRELIDLPVNSATLIEQLNLLGLEVDAVESAAPAFSDIVVAEILEIEAHPDADRLRVCKVDVGEAQTLQIVCGAANAAVGLKAPLAKVGAQLPNGGKIKKGKLRGVESFGMLCSEAELGLAETADGLMALPADAPVGESLRGYLDLDDQLIEIDLTPNRGDCLSILGVAREVALTNRLPPPAININPVAAVIDDTFVIRLDEPQACPRYVGRVIRGVNPNVKSPVWMVEKLRRSGIRSISPAVDISNYVMLELGQPMHAFDLDKLNGEMHVRNAKPDETLLLLDGSEASLQANTLVIADEQGPCAIAGIMGGQDSAVSDSTENIFLESAFFAPTAILGRSRQYGLHTDSSHRFERGVDPALQHLAIERATALLLEVMGGQPGPVIEVESQPDIPVKSAILLRQSRISRLLGHTFSVKEVETILAGLGAEYKSVAETWQVTPPSYRFDLNIEPDLIEELARVYGYENLPRIVPAFVPSELVASELSISLDTIKSSLVQTGYHEIVSYSFIDPALQTILEPEQAPLMLSNPIASDMAAMRTSLLPGLLKTLQYNLNRQQKQLSLFETGLRFVQQDTDIKQEKMIAGVRYGSRMEEGWHTDSQALDFYDIKADVERLLILGGHDYEFKVAEHPGLHPGQSAQIWVEGLNIGWIGAIHPRIERTFGLDNPAFIFELVLSPLLSGQAPKFATISKFPSIRRDLAIVVDTDLDWCDIEACIHQAAPDCLKEVRIFDIYTGKGVMPGRKSVAIGLILQEISRTLTDEEIESAKSQILLSLNQNLGATLRE